jgi:lysophospholipase L1-like esterase
MRNVFTLCLCLCFSSNAFAGQVLVSLGDSITRGFNAKRLGDNTSFSWATGEEVHSFWERLSPQSGDRVYNLAVVGAQSGDIGTQLLFMPEVPTHVTMLIGANDMCRNKPLEHTIANIKDNISAIYKRGANIALTVVPIPKISSVYYAKKDERWCRFVWSISGLCSGFIGIHTSEEVILENQRLLDGLNSAILEIVGQFNSTNEHPRIRFNPEIGIAELFNDDISDIDCFHPSIKGQQRIADMVEESY